MRPASSDALAWSAAGTRRRHRVRPPLTMSLMLAPTMPAEDNCPSARVALSRLAKLATCRNTLPTCCCRVLPGTGVACLQSMAAVASDPTTEPDLDPGTAPRGDAVVANPAWMAFPLKLRLTAVLTLRPNITPGLSTVNSLLPKDRSTSNSPTRT